MGDLQKPNDFPTAMITTEHPHGEEFPILRIDTALCSGAVSLYGGHVLEWAPKGAKPVLFTSPTMAFKQGKALRGGIPVCWPWFGKNTEAPALPSHGVARTALWQLAKQEEDEDGTVRLLLALPPAAELMPSAALAIEMGRTLTVSLMTLDVPRSMPFSAALHAYFAVSDYEKAAVTGLEECAFTEFADDPVEHAEDPLIPAGHIDRIYCPVDEHADITIHDPAWGRSIRITRAGSGSAVVWNPGAKLAEGMGDLGAGNERGMLCVETTAVPAENILLRCGDTHQLTMHVELVDIS